ncbi:MAG: ComF family protein [Verrucomicrobiota bacterium]
MADLPNRLLDIVYPRTCPGCETSDWDPGPVRLCHHCSKQLTPLPSPFCDICGEPFVEGSQAGTTCRRCRDSRPEYDFARAPFLATDLLREMIHSFKYGRQMHLSPLLATLLEQSLGDRRFSLEETWLLVPVPLHPRRERERHFNQSAELCSLLAQSRGFERCNALRRIRYTSAQAHLERKERLTNLVDAFALSRLAWQQRAIQRANILLVDDVMTTGSTANECAKVLKRVGSASKVAVITVARASATT